MSALPEQLLYTEGHSWIRRDDDGLYAIGITEHGQSLLGDLVFVQLPEPGTRVEEGGLIATLESVKSAWDVLAPAELEVVEVNEGLQGSPEMVNEEPYEAGWIARCRIEGELPPLMDASAYQDFIGE